VVKVLHKSLSLPAAKRLVKVLHQSISRPFSLQVQKLMIFQHLSFAMQKRLI
jgi:hypothetical protein